MSQVSLTCQPWGHYSTFQVLLARIFHMLWELLPVTPTPTANGTSRRSKRLSPTCTTQGSTVSCTTTRASSPQESRCSSPEDRPLLMKHSKHRLWTPSAYLRMLISQVTTPRGAHQETSCTCSVDPLCGAHVCKSCTRSPPRSQKYTVLRKH